MQHFHHYIIVNCCFYFFSPGKLLEKFLHVFIGKNNQTAIGKSLYILIRRFLRKERIWIADKIIFAHKETGYFAAIVAKHTITHYTFRNKTKLPAYFTLR